MRELWRHRAFLHILVWRDLKVRYKQTVVGLAWALFEPLVMTVVFSIFLGYLVRVPSDDLPYPVFFLAGFVPWQFFAKTAMAGGQSLVANREGDVLMVTVTAGRNRARQCQDEIMSHV